MSLTINEAMLSNPKVAHLTVPDCGHSAVFLDLSPRRVWTCYHREHGNGGTPAQKFAERRFKVENGKAEFDFTTPEQEEYEQESREILDHKRTCKKDGFCMICQSL
jgi:hypothetical protein